MPVKKCVKCKEEDVVIEAPYCAFCNSPTIPIEGSNHHIMFKCNSCNHYTPLGCAICDKCFGNMRIHSWENQYNQVPEQPR